jgi:hypothetical protein
VFSLLLGCSGSQALKTRRRAELTLGGSLIGVIVGSLGIAAFTDHKPVFIGITAAFGAVAVGSTIVYGVAYGSSPPPEPVAAPPPPPDRRNDAWDRTKEAQAAARLGDCTTVKSLAIQVKALNEDFYWTVFARDAAIARCQTP